jgi:hypothetical protein
MMHRALELLDEIRHEVLSLQASPSGFGPHEIGVIIGAMFQAKIWRNVPNHGEFTTYVFDTIQEMFPVIPPKDPEDISRMLSPYFISRGLNPPTRLQCTLIYDQLAPLFSFHE